MFFDWHEDLLLQRDHLTLGLGQRETLLLVAEVEQTAAHLEDLCEQASIRQ